LKQRSYRLWRGTIALILAVVLTVMLIPIAHAAEITVNDAVVGQTYRAYRIFDVTKTAGDPVGYAYSIRSDHAWYADVAAYAAENNSGLTLSRTTDPTVFNVSVDASIFSAANFAAYLNGKTEGKEPDGSAVATETSVTVSVEEAGYYFLDSSLGALCILHTAADTVTVNEKNPEPSIEKTVQETSASIGDTIHFEITVTAGGAADTSYIVHDRMESGLTLDPTSFVLTCNGETISNDAYEIAAPAEDGHSFDIVFSNVYTASLSKDDKIEISYAATLNENAEIADETNDNTVHLSYGNSSSVEQRTETKTYRFDLVKMTADHQILDGAVFRLYDAETGGNEIALVQSAPSVYRPALDGETGAEVQVGKATIQGLASGTYYLEETAAPAGYNRLTARVAVTIAEQNLTAVFTDEGLYESGGIAVENLTGSQLPSTGGVGTTVFYVIGASLMAAAAAVYLWHRRQLRQRG